MNYEGQICRAPMERASFMLPVMVGCSYNRCKFCNLFRHLKYRELPLEQIEAELMRVKNLNGNPKRIFLGDGNAFDLKTPHLLEILNMIETYFPEREAVNMDATVSGVLRKSDEELRMLYEHGVRHLYLGIESGLDDVLGFMNKDHNLEQAYRAIERLQAAGMVYDAHIMTGVAGKGRGMENAEALAKFLNETHPAHVVNFSMFLHKEVALFSDIENGTFVPADELENLKEERRLLELLARSEDEQEILYEGFHDFIECRVRGTLPKDREKMLAKLDEVICREADKKQVFSYVQGECPNLERCDGNPVWSVNVRPKIAIIYKSLTGNTKIIAEAIKKELKEGEIVYFGEPQENIDADLYLVGSWTDKGMCVKEISEFLQSLRNKKIAYFGTAGFGGSLEYYESLYKRVCEVIDESNEMRGYFFCQGKMPMSVRARYVQMIQEHPDDKKLQVSLENFDKALSHPDENDIADVRKWINTLRKK